MVEDWPVGGKRATKKADPTNEPNTSVSPSKAVLDWKLTKFFPKNYEN